MGSDEVEKLRALVYEHCTAFIDDDGNPDICGRWKKLATAVTALSAQPCVHGLLNPDMPSQELKLHMGEMTAQEERTARAAIRWANASRPQPAAVDGWVMVPREPTEEMGDAGAEIIKKAYAFYSMQANDVYRAMIAAAPKNAGGGHE